MEPRKIIEAALFLSPRPLTTKELAEIAGCDPDTVLKSISEIESSLKGAGSALIVERIGNAFRLSVDPEVYPFVAHLAPLPEFSRSELKVLAELAVKGKVPLSRVKKVRGWEGFLKKVLNLGIARKVRSGRATYLVKTPLFEKYFALTEE